MISLFFHISTVVKIVKYEPLTEQTFTSRDVWQIPYTHNTRGRSQNVDHKVCTYTSREPSRRVRAQLRQSWQMYSVISTYFSRCSATVSIVTASLVTCIPSSPVDLHSDRPNWFTNSRYISFCSFVILSVSRFWIHFRPSGHTLFSHALNTFAIIFPRRTDYSTALQREMVVLRVINVHLKEYFVKLVLYLLLYEINVKFLVTCRTM